MNQHDGIDINWLLGEFFALEEEWKEDPLAFTWDKLRTLAWTGARAYNEGRGPSFHALAIDGMIHNEFHYRFLLYSIEAGFDPFKLTCAGTGPSSSVISHDDLAEASLANPWSARMRELLFEEASKRFPLQDVENAPEDVVGEAGIRTIEACAPSIPVALLERVSPELVSYHPRKADGHKINAVEAYLSVAEVAAEDSKSPW
jgi:hypothetical protein